VDFYQIKERSTKNGVLEIYPDFKVCRSNDLMIRGRNVYAIWDQEQGMWSTDEYDVQRLVDEELYKYREGMQGVNEGSVRIKLMSDFSSKTWSEFKSYINHLSDHSHQLDSHLTFSNDKIKKRDYVSKTLPYPLEEGNLEGYEELISTLYDHTERAKLEWAIGAIISGDAKDIQKFIVLYGEAGAGKSTILNIIQRLFEGYYTTFDAKALTSNSNAFSTEIFKNNPLVAIQHDGDLSKIEDNTKLNSIVSHEDMTMNEKYKPSYMSKINCFLFMATNKPVKITDAKSGIIRRLIDVKPSGRKLPPHSYQAAMSKINFELGSIASHCLKKYQSMGKNYYSDYRPLDMIMQTDVFYNFVEGSFFVFQEQNGVTLSQGYTMYKEYCDDSLVEYKLPKHKFREELRNYFREFHDIKRIDGKQVRNYYHDFIEEKFTSITRELDEDEKEHQYSLVLDSKESLLDDILKNYKAQYATKTEVPKNKWSDVKTKLKDIDTKKIHYVQPPINHIVIDFDIKDEEGNKSLEKNIEAASLWPATYAELSKGGNGIHLHYIYTGDPEELSMVYDDYVEIKVFKGDSSLRRKLTVCNKLDIAEINSGLPLKGEKMINFTTVRNEKAIRTSIIKALRKEIHPNTKSNIDFIFKVLDDAYIAGIKYDVTDLRPAIMAFGNMSSNQSSICMKTIGKMKFKSDEPSDDHGKFEKNELVFYDVEVLPNFLGVVYKKKGKPTVRLYNPEPHQLEELMKFMLVGFNVRRYDNHIIYARYIGYTIEQVYNLSKKIIEKSNNVMFAEAYGISHVDIYEMALTKQSLKKWQIELGLKHKELKIGNEPVDKNRIEEIMEYCENDVITTEQLFDHLSDEYNTKLILSELSGLSPNDTTQKHAAKIIFGNDTNPQKKFIYRDLSEEFPGYKFDMGKSTYRGEDVSEGGEVYAEPGVYSKVALLDIASQHPNSLIQMNHFGPYTKKVVELVEARIAIKHGEYEKASKMLNGILAKYLDGSKESADRLSTALKRVINIIYGLTAATFDNPFKDPRNIDNIVAKRGALFMIDLKHAVWEQGYSVAHIKTDSIKIPNADDKIIDFVISFGKKYGYDFEHEATFDRMFLVNKAVYIAKYGWTPKEKLIGTWTATGTQFAVPYVFKTLFSKEPIEFRDLCEVKSVTTSLYLDFNEKLPEGEHDYNYVGKVGMFCPVKPNVGGGLLMRESSDKSGSIVYHAATGSTGYRWKESDMIEVLDIHDEIDMSYFTKQVDEARDAISKYCDFEQFVTSDNFYINNVIEMPWD